MFNRLRLSACILSLTVLFVVGCSKDSDTNTPVNEPAITAAQQAVIQASIDSLLQVNNIPGAAFGFWCGTKEPVFMARGVSDISTGRALTINDRFRIASNTKMFTAQVILQLADSQKLSLDEPISGWFKDVPNAATIKVRDLLGMTSGLGDYASEPAFSTSYFSNPTKVWGRSTMYNMICGLATQFSPGEQCVYCNTNFYLLGMIIEQVTGHKAEDEIRNRILIPWGMSNTEFPTSDQITGTYSHGYRDWQGTVNSDVTAVHPSGPWTGGAMVSTIGDLKTFIQSVSQGRGLSASMKQQAMTWKPMTAHLWYGLGVAKWAGFIGHDGTILGFNSWVGYYPALDVTYVCFVNKCNDDNTPDLANRVNAIVFRTLYGAAFPFE